MDETREAPSNIIDITVKPDQINNLQNWRERLLGEERGARSLFYQEVYVEGGNNFTSAIRNKVGIIITTLEKGQQIHIKPSPDSSERRSFRGMVIETPLLDEEIPIDRAFLESLLTKLYPLEEGKPSESEPLLSALQEGRELVLRHETPSQSQQAFSS